MSESNQPTQPASPAFLHSTRFQALILGALVLFLFWWRLGSLGLIDPDEPFYALTSREMVQTGDWLTPRVFGEPQFEKPILFYWETCLAQLTFGDNEFAARVPGALAASFLVFLTWGIGRRLLTPFAGFLAAVVLATGVEFVLMTRLMLTDISHALFITAGMYCLWRAFHDEEKRTRWLLLLTVTSALGMLTKGPQGLCFTLMAGAVYAWCTGRRQPWSAKHLAMCVPLWLIIVVPWYLAMFILHHSGPTSPVVGWGYYWDSFFIHENWDRMWHAEHQGNNTWYYYIEMLLGGSLPWIPLVGAALWEAGKNIKVKFREQPGLTFVLCWLVPCYVFMTIAQSKLPSYIFFLFVPVALLAGRTLERWINQGFGPVERWIVGGLTFFQGFMLAIYTPAFHPHAIPFKWQLYALGIPLLLAGIFALTRRAFLWASISATFNIVLIFTAFFWIEPVLEGTVGSREICKIATKVRLPGEPLMTCSFLGRAANYYMGEIPVGIFVPDQKNLGGHRNFRPYYPFYSYHPLRQFTIEKQLGEYADQRASVLCIGEQRDFISLNQDETSSVRGRCELLGQTGEKPGRSVFRIHAKGWIPASQSTVIK